jgi:hypothetical protein
VRFEVELAFGDCELDCALFPWAKWVDVTENQLKGAPKFNQSTDWDWSNRAKDQAVYNYYRVELWY